MNLAFSKLATSSGKRACLKHRYFSEQSKLIVIAMDASSLILKQSYEWPNTIAEDLQEVVSEAQ